MDTKQIRGHKKIQTTNATSISIGTALSYIKQYGTVVGFPPTMMCTTKKLHLKTIMKFACAVKIPL